MEDDTRLGRVGDRPSWIRTGSVFVRAAHLLAASAVAGAVLLDVEDPVVHTWWIAAAVSGVVLLVAESMRHVELYRELGGWSTVLKLALVGGIAVVPAAGPGLMAAAVVVAALGAHLPRRWRHRKLF